MYDNPPNSQVSAFKCPLCGADSKQSWLDVLPSRTVIEGKELKIAQCTHCNKLTYWLDGKILSHAPASGPSPGSDQSDKNKQA